MKQFKSTYVQSLSHYVPDRVVTNEEIIQMNSLKMKSSWVEGRLGISERRWASSDQTTSDLAVEALKKVALVEAPLVLSTISPDYLTPSTSSEIKRKLGWKGSAQAIDISAACAGFIFSMELAALLSEASFSKQSDGKVYAVAAETRSRYLDLHDRRTVFLFADAAVSCSVVQSSEGSLAQLMWTSCSTEGISEPEILVPAGGAKTPLTEELVRESQHKIKMVDGVAITNLIEERLVATVRNCLQQMNEKIEDYSYLIFHQGNGQLIANILNQLGMPQEKTHINFGRYGNSSSASVGVAFSEAAQLGKFENGQKILLVAMGAGYHLGVASLKWLK